MKTTLEDFVDKTLDLIMFQFFHFAAKKKNFLGYLTRNMFGPFLVTDAAQF